MENSRRVFARSAAGCGKRGARRAPLHSGNSAESQSAAQRGLPGAKLFFECRRAAERKRGRSGIGFQKGSRGNFSADVQAFTLCLRRADCRRIPDAGGRLPGGAFRQFGSKRGKAAGCAADQRTCRSNRGREKGMRRAASSFLSCGRAGARRSDPQSARWRKNHHSAGSGAASFLIGAKGMPD